ncbi:MAG: Spy/CpxP family protein refolding chaperone [Rhodoplanes sp.]
MKKVVMIIAAAALIAGAAFGGSAYAQKRGDRADRAELTANQIIAQTDARTARIKADLRLTPEQEKNWLGLESALRDIGKNRADRLVAFRAERAQQKESDGVIEYLKSNAKFLGERSANVKKLADAAQPLYESLDEQQKRRFARDLIRLSRERDIDARDFDR